MFATLSNGRKKKVFRKNWMILISTYLMSVKQEDLVVRLDLFFSHLLFLTVMRRQRIGRQPISVLVGFPNPR